MSTRLPVVATPSLLAATAAAPERNSIALGPKVEGSNPCARQLVRTSCGFFAFVAAQHRLLFGLTF